MQAERYRTAPPITRYSILRDRYLSIIPIDSDVTPPKSNQTPENRGDDRVIGQNGDRTANKALVVVILRFRERVIRVEQEGTSSDPRVRNSRQARDPLNLELEIPFGSFVSHSAVMAIITWRVTWESTMGPLAIELHYWNRE